MTTQRATRRIFIIHSQEDTELVRDLERRLRAVGLEPFADVDDPAAGGEWRQVLRDQLRAVGLEPFANVDDLAAVGERQIVLRDRLGQADAFVGLVTSAALDSSWTMTALGMAEGFGKPMVLVSAGLLPRRLPAPLASDQLVPFDQLDGALSQLAQRLADE
jgi:hypothetical protein